ncbi:transposase domain-containing protein [Microvirga sp. BT689]|nr:transposase domain-containing protein [Microvirga arvi]
MASTRKNALAAESDRGGEHWAIIAFFVETCKLCGVDLQAYLTDVLSRMVIGHLNTQMDDLLPQAYATTQDLKNVASDIAYRSSYISPIVCSSLLIMSRRAEVGDLPVHR